MTCPKCKAPIDAQMKACLKCGAVVAKADEVGRIRARKSGCQVAVIAVVSTLLAFGFFIYIISSSMMEERYQDIAKKGEDIVVAIIAANVEREPLGLGNVWPKTVIPSGTDTAVKDISNTPYNNSSDYFYDLYDGENVGKTGHIPYVRGFDYSKLAGAGIPAKAGPGKLEAKNNMWIIAANITEADDPRIPVLISRNVDIKEFERIVNKGLKKSEFRKRVTLNKLLDRPFQEEGYVMICKDGRMIFSRGWFKKNMGELFDHKELPSRDPSKPPIVYLMP